MDGRRGCAWAVEDAPADFVAMQIRAIVGIEIPIARIEGKWKMSQNRTPADRQGVVAVIGRTATRSWRCWSRRGTRESED